MTSVSLLRVFDDPAEPKNAKLLVLNTCFCSDMTGQIQETTY